MDGWDKPGHDDRCVRGRVWLAHAFFPLAHIFIPPMAPPFIGAAPAAKPLTWPGSASAAFTIPASLSSRSAAAPALAQEFKAGDITIDKAWARATPKGTDVGAGYLVVHNNGATPDTLTGGSSDFATVEIHEMKTEGGHMTMAEMKNGLNIPLHGTVRLAPGGYHKLLSAIAKGRRWLNEMISGKVEGIEAIAAREGVSERSARMGLVHHGNGTQHIFWDDRTVMYASTHEMPLFPGTGSGGARPPSRRLCSLRQDQPRGHSGACLCPVPLQQSCAPLRDGDAEPRYFSIPATMRCRS